MAALFLLPPKYTPYSRLKSGGFVVCSPISCIAEFRAMEPCPDIVAPTLNSSVRGADLDGSSIGRSRKHKSAVTNGSRLLPGVDGRSPWVRRCRDILEDLVADHGGFEMVSAAELNITRRAAVLTTELEILEAKFATDGQASASDLDLYTRAAGNLRRLLEAIGIRRDPTRARNVTPIEDLLAQLDDREKAAAEAEVVEP
jgi:hypothetical protein